MLCQAVEGNRGAPRPPPYVKCSEHIKSSKDGRSAPSVRPDTHCLPGSRDWVVSSWSTVTRELVGPRSRPAQFSRTQARGKNQRGLPLTISLILISPQLWPVKQFLWRVFLLGQEKGAGRVSISCSHCALQPWEVKSSFPFY